MSDRDKEVVSPLLPEYCQPVSSSLSLSLFSGLESQGQRRKAYRISATRTMSPSLTRKYGLNSLRTSIGADIVAISPSSLRLLAPSTRGFLQITHAHSSLRPTSLPKVR